MSVKKYLISYDQHKDRNYQPIWNLLKNAGAVRLLESFWVVTAPGNCAAIRDEIKRVTRNEDSIVVIEIPAGTDWATWSAQPAGVNWLSEQILRAA